MRAELLTDESELESIRAPWDALAVETRRPFCAPPWVLAWWRHVSPDGAAIRAVAISEGGRLLGLAPLWVGDPSGRRAHYDVMAGRLGPTGLLVAPGRESEVAKALARALADARPKLALLRLEERTGAGHIAGRLVRSWPGLRPWTHVAPATPVPIVSLGGIGYKDWLESKSSSFRRETKRNRRRIETAGARFALAGPDDAERAVGAFLDLHAARWRDRGGSSVLVPGIREMLLEAARELLPEQRMRIFLLELEGKPIAAQILLAAGGEADCWQGGFDEEWKELSPSAQLILHAIEKAAERGESRIDLGSGGQEYKRRMANAEEQIAVVKLLPRGLSYPRNKLRLLAAEARESRSG